MSDFISSQKSQFDKIIEFLQKEIYTLRIGRATPSLVESVMVEAYGSITPLNQLAGINVTDPKTLTIQPWDKSVLKAIESALQKADLGSSPIIQENLIIVSLPSMTEENRLNVIKKMNQKLEETKVSIRNLREKIKENVIQDEKDKVISEDDKFKRLEELDALVKSYNEKIREMGSKKEEEIMKI